MILYVGPVILAQRGSNMHDEARVGPEKTKALLRLLQGSPISSVFNQSSAATRCHFVTLLTGLTGSDSQTEFAVSHSKQTLKKILTGARMHIKLFRILQPRTQNLARVQAFQRISTRFWPTSRMRRNSLKINNSSISTRGHNCTFCPLGIPHFPPFLHPQSLQDQARLC